MDNKRKASVTATRMAARTLCTTLFLLLLSASAASAATITVDEGGGAGYTDVQAVEEYKCCKFGMS